jgi:putative SOS response-associated peptidase YedK
MCGRYSQTKPVEAMRRLFRFEGGLDLPPRYNIAPSQMVPTVRQDDDGDRSLDFLRWGLVPRWADDSPTGPINARAETIATNSMFKNAFARQRCLVLADAFYEWQVGTKPKQPWRIAMADGAPFAFAGVWESWGPAPGGEAALETVAIVTTTANETVAPIHGRMPVIIDQARADHWLAPDTSRNLLEKVMRPYPAGAMIAHTVSRRVNAPAFDDPGCAEPWSGEEADQRTII